MPDSPFDAPAPARLWQVALAAILLVGAVFLAYSSVLDGRFIWDDGFLVLRNSFIRSPVLILECFQHFLFIDSGSVFYRPVQNISYLFDYWRGGLQASIYHQTNLLIHGLNAVLLFILARRWLVPGAWLGALILALLWALHPVHSATAAYIAGRADSLALFFFLIGWWSWEKSLTAQRVIFRRLLYVVAALSGLLAMCSKEIASEAMLLFVLHLWLVRSDLSRKTRLQSSLVSIILFACYIFLRQLPEASVAANPPPDFSPVERMHMFFRALGDYFRLMLWPDRLYMERQIIDQPTLLRRTSSFDPVFPWLGCLGALFMVLLLASVLWKKEGRKLRTFGALWFIVMILPVSNLFPLNASVAEHWLYFPSIGFLLCLAGCWNGWRIRGLVPYVLLVVAVLSLGARTSIRAADWHDAYTFFEATIRDGGDSIRMRINLASEYKKRGKPREAEALYRSILARIPSYTWVKILLADHLRSEGRVAEADALLQTVPEEQSDQVQDQTAYVGQLLLANRVEEAQHVARSLYEKSPAVWSAASLYAHTFRRQNHPEAAAIIIRGFAQRHWWHAESHQVLGELLATSGKPDEAIAAWNHVARLDIRNGQAYAMSAALLSSLSRFREAEIYQKKSIKREPTAAGWAALAEIRRNAKDETGAAEATREAERIRASAQTKR